MMILIILTRPKHDLYYMITATDKSAFKARMLEACIQKQESLIEDFKTRMHALLENGPLGNEEEYDNSIRAQNIQSSNEVDTLNAALTFARQEMDILLRLRTDINRPYTRVAQGSVVVTDKSVFFVSVSIEQFEVDGETFIGLSEKSPLMQAMKGKAKGEQFTCQGITYRITDIF